MFNPIINIRINVTNLTLNRTIIEDKIIVDDINYFSLYQIHTPIFNRVMN